MTIKTTPDFYVTPAGVRLAWDDEEKFYRAEIGALDVTLYHPSKFGADEWFAGVGSDTGPNAEVDHASDYPKLTLAWIDERIAATREALGRVPS